MANQYFLQPKALYSDSNNHLRSAIVEMWGYDIVSGDFNCDGHIDLIVGGKNRILLSLGDGKGNFGQIIEEWKGSGNIPGSSLETLGYMKLTVCDVNEDNIPDIVVVAYNGGHQNVLTFINIFECPTTSTSNSTTSSFTSTVTNTSSTASSTTTKSSSTDFSTMFKLMESSSTSSTNTETSSTNTPTTTETQASSSTQTTTHSTDFSTMFTLVESPTSSTSTSTITTPTITEKEEPLNSEHTNLEERLAQIEEKYLQLEDKNSQLETKADASIGVAVLSLIALCGYVIYTQYSKPSSTATAPYSHKPQKILLDPDGYVVDNTVAMEKNPAFVAGENYEPVDTSQT